MGWYSRLERVVAGLPTNYKGEADQTLKMLEKKGVKPDELKYSAVRDRVDFIGEDGYVTKADLEEAIAARGDKHTYSMANLNADVPDFLQSGLTPGGKQSPWNEVSLDPNQPSYINIGRYGDEHYADPSMYMTENNPQYDAHYPLEKDLLYWTRGLENQNIGGTDYRVLEEIQSPLHQRGKYSKDFPLKRSYRRKAIERELENAIEQGRPLAIPLSGGLSSGMFRLGRSEGVQNVYEKILPSIMRKIAKDNNLEYKEIDHTLPDRQPRWSSRMDISSAIDDMLEDPNVELRHQRDEWARAFPGTVLDGPFGPEILEFDELLELQGALREGYIEFDAYQRLLNDFKDRMAAGSDNSSGIKYGTLTPNKYTNTDFELYEAGAPLAAAAYMGAQGDDESLWSKITSGASEGLSNLGELIQRNRENNPHYQRDQVKRAANTQKLGSGLEALTTMGTAAALEVPAGFAGIAGLPFGPDQAVKNIEAVQGMGYQPKDPSVLMNAVGPIMPLMKKLEEHKRSVGDKVEGATGSPTLGSIASIYPEILGAGLSLTPMGLARRGAASVDTDAPDMSRRKFLKDAAILGTGAAVASKLPAPSLLGDTSSAAKVATAAKMPNMLKVHPSSYNFMTFAQAFPEVDWLDILQERGVKGVNETINELTESGSPINVPWASFDETVNPDEVMKLYEGLNAENPPGIDFDLSGWDKDFIESGSLDEIIAYQGRPLNESMDDSSFSMYKDYEEWGEIFNPFTNNMDMRDITTLDKIRKRKEKSGDY